MKVGDLVRDRRVQFSEDIGVIIRLASDIDFDPSAFVLWATGEFEGKTTEEMFEYLEVMENA